MMEINGGKNMVVEYCSSRTLANLIHKYYALWPQGGMSPSSMPLQLIVHVMKRLAEAL
jgi:hypothetical protein